MIDKTLKVADWALEGPEEVKYARKHALGCELRVLESEQAGLTPDPKVVGQLQAYRRVTRGHLVSRLAAAGVAAIVLGAAIGSSLSDAATLNGDHYSDQGTQAPSGYSHKGPRVRR